MTTYPPGRGNPEPPARWRAVLASYDWMELTNGCSGAQVFRLDHDTEQALIAKSEPAGPFAELPGEIDRLRWLGEQQIPCPRIVETSLDGDRWWLLMTALPGHDMATPPLLHPEHAVTIAATSLRALHRLDPDTCPFDARLDLRISLARKRMEAGQIDEEDLGDADAHKLFAALSSTRPHTEDLVVTHGDATLSNMIAHQGEFTGFIDCSRAGIADRHQDLAITARDIAVVFGEQWVTSFLRAYGAEADREALPYFRLLDQFF
ncbi:APH(3') family aminoglycoside O-phosphotransferase [Rhodococcus opacus]|uniref:Aminoglycoside phosphotransferase domain-containing protein n=1 Tax=Rhodococcus opacus TaxID=37919 RepID=A0A076EYV8_RHOOP|nr:APH(3') family aminoglycoside O-phosphotransferase [Rhodococcus opacus]AII10432.1 hypothetical protein EP51_39775 [Rhodococcus opacus]